MGKYIFDESDLDDETAIYIDKYFKKVIINAKKQYLGRLAKDTRIIFNSMEENRINKNELCNIEDLTYEEFVIDNLSVKVYNEDIANALKQMSYRQQYVIIKDFFFDVPLYIIAKELNVSTRMINKYKKSALKILKEEYEINEGTAGARQSISDKNT